MILADLFLPFLAPEPIDRSWVLDCRGLVVSSIHKSTQTATAGLPRSGRPGEPRCGDGLQLAVNLRVVVLLGPELVLLSIS